MIARDSSVLAVVPARGGSKGIPRKNLTPLAGHPLLWWTVESVRAAEQPIRLVVSTDDAEIADLALGWGSEVAARPPELAADESPTELAIEHILAHVPGALQARILMLLQPTSPIRLPGSLDRAIEWFAKGTSDSLVGVVSEPPFLWRGPEESPTPLYDPPHRKRRQDMDAKDLAYRETGSLYLTTVEAFRASGNRISGRVGLYVMSATEGVDIDTLDDLALAETLLRGSLQRRLK